MKRSAALAPLSRDHHEALVVARVLSRTTEADAVSSAERFVQFLSGHELAHFALEESLLLPALPNEPGARALAERIRSDHAEFREASRHLQASNHPPAVSLLRGLGARLRAHVQLEERELFPYVERALDSEALETLGTQLTGELGDHRTSGA